MMLGNCALVVVFQILDTKWWMAILETHWQSEAGDLLTFSFRFLNYALPFIDFWRYSTRHV